MDLGLEVIILGYFRPKPVHSIEPDTENSQR